MKAVVITAPGGPEVLQVRQVAAPCPSMHELLIEVRATALNRADLLQRRGLYPAPAGVPEGIPGLEFAGTVVKIGAQVQWFAAGDRVMGLIAGAGYAEYVVVHERLVLPIPVGITFTDAAAIPEVFATAFDALIPQLGIAMGERLLIHAVGSGVGTAALQLAKAAGAEVFGTAGSGDKLSAAAELGLDHGINYKTQSFADVVAERTDGQGVHAILDMVGGSYLEQNLRSLTERGRLLTIGLLGGSKGEIDLGALLRKRLSVAGSALRGRALEEKAVLMQSLKKHVLPLVADNKVKAIVDCVFPLEKAGDAHALMESNRNFGKIVLQVKDD